MLRTWRERAARAGGAVELQRAMEDRQMDGQGDVKEVWRCWRRAGLGAVQGSRGRTWTRSWDWRLGLRLRTGTRTRPHTHVDSAFRSLSRAAGML